MAESPPSSSLVGGLVGREPSSHFETVLHGFEASIADIVARSMITSSFSADDRFEWRPYEGFRVGIPDVHKYVLFTRAPPSELHDRLFPVADHGHRQQESAQHKPLPERSLAWWFAQLVHYGLPITIDRDHAKESLKAAMQKDRLEVPLRLRELETRLKRQYVITPDKHPGMNAPLLLSQHNKQRIFEPSWERSGLQELKGRQADHDMSFPLTRTQLGKPKQPSGTASRLFELGADSDSISTSESDEEPFHIPEDQRHLFTPHGVRITRPAEYPGLRERDERLRQEQEKKKEAAQAQFTQKQLNQANMLGNAAKNNVVVEDEVESSEPSSASDLRDDDNVVVPPPLSTLTEKLKKSEHATPMGKRHKVVGQLGDGLEVEDDTDDGTTSPIFYTPMEFIRRRPDKEKDRDDVSVIVTGSRKKPAPPRQSADNPKANDSAKVQPREEASKKNPVHINEAKNKKVAKQLKQIPNRHEQPTMGKTSHGFRKAKGATVKNASKKSRRRPKHLKEPQDVIEITSDSERIANDSDEDRGRHEADVKRGTVSRSKSMPAHRSKHSRSEPQSKKGTTISNRQSSTLSKNQPGMTSVQLPVKNAKSVQSARIGENTANNATDGFPAMSLSRSKRRYSNENTANAGPGLHARSSKKPNTKPQSSRVQGEVRSQAVSQPCEAGGFETVRDLTDCGITETFGGLHPNDQHVMQSDGSLGDQQRFESPIQKPQSETPIVFQHPPSLPPLPSHDESDFDLPSLKELFSSQETPEAWRTKSSLSSAAKKRQREIEKSYDPDSVPTLREELATLPAYLKTFMRHASPELSQTSPIRQVAKVKDPFRKSGLRRERSRATSVVPMVRKRSRPTMIEIEAETGKELSSKRPCLISTQKAPASPSLDDMRSQMHKNSSAMAAEWVEAQSALSVNNKQQKKTRKRRGASVAREVQVRN